MGSMIHFLNGKFVSERKLLISPRDLGYLRGYAVTDFLVTYNHKPFKLSEHIDRLFRSAEIIGLRIPWSKSQIALWVNETLDKNDKETEKTMKIVLSGGVSHSLRQADTPTIVMIVSDRVPKPVSQYEMGIKVRTVKYSRPFPEAKHTYFVEAIRDFAAFKGEDIEDIIYYDDLQVYEGSGTNIFAVIDNKLITPKSHIVPGITRNTLLEILKLNIPVEVRDFTIDELRSAFEVFLAGSNSEVRGVVEIDGKPVADGKVGKITQEAARQYKEYVIRATYNKQERL